MISVLSAFLENLPIVIYNCYSFKKWLHKYVPFATRVVDAKFVLKKLIESRNKGNKKKNEIKFSQPITVFEIVFNAKSQAFRERQLTSSVKVVMKFSVSIVWEWNKI